MSDRLEDLLAGGGERTSGKFRLDRSRAVETMQRFQLATPHGFILMFHQAMRALGAQEIRYRIDSNDVELSAPVELPPRMLQELWDGLFIRPATAHDEAWHRLALGVNAALALKPAYVKIASGGHELVVRGYDALELSARVKDAGIRIHVRQRLDLSTVREAVLLVVKQPPEAALLERRCALDEAQIYLNRRRVRRTRPELWSGAIAGGRYVAQPAAIDAPWPIVKLGVALDSHALPLELPIDGAIVADSIRTSVSQDTVVQDAELEQLLRQTCNAVLREAAAWLGSDGAVSRRTVAMAHALALALHEPALKELRPALMARLRSVPWVPIPAAFPLAPEALLMQAERLGSVPYITKHERVPPGLLVVRGAAEAVAVVSIGGDAHEAENVDGKLDALYQRYLRVELMHRRKRKPEVDRAFADVVVPVLGKDIKGELGLLRYAAPGTVALLRNGIQLTEEALPTWAEGLCAVVDSPALKTDQEVLRVLRDPTYRAALEAVRQAVPSLIALAASQRHRRAAEIARGYLAHDLATQSTKARALWKGTPELELLRHLAVFQGLARDYSIADLAAAKGPVFVVDEPVSVQVASRAFGDEPVVLGQGLSGELLRAVAPESLLENGAGRVRAAQRWLVPARTMTLPPGVQHQRRFTSDGVAGLVGLGDGVATAEVSIGGRPLVDLAFEDLPTGLRFAVDAHWLEPNDFGEPPTGQRFAVDAHWLQPNADHDGLASPDQLPRLRALLLDWARRWAVEAAGAVAPATWRRLALELIAADRASAPPALLNAELLPAASGQLLRLAWLDEELARYGEVLWARPDVSLLPLRFGRDYLVLGPQQRDAVRALVGTNRLTSAVGAMEAAQRFQAAIEKAPATTKRQVGFLPVRLAIEGATLGLSVAEPSGEGVLVVAEDRVICSLPLPEGLPVEGRLAVPLELVDDSARGLFSPAKERLAAAVVAQARALALKAGDELDRRNLLRHGWLEAAFRRCATDQEGFDRGHFFVDVAGDRRSLQELRSRPPVAVPESFRLKIDLQQVRADREKGLVYAHDGAPLGYKPAVATVLVSPEELKRLLKCGVALVQAGEPFATELTGWVRRHRQAVDGLELPASQVVVQQRFELEGGVLLLALLPSPRDERAFVEILIDGRPVTRRALALPGSFTARLDAPGLIPNPAFDDVVSNAALGRLLAETRDKAAELVVPALRASLTPSARSALLAYLLERGVEGLAASVADEPLVPALRGPALSLRAVMELGARGKLDVATRLLHGHPDLGSAVPDGTLFVDATVAAVLEARFGTRDWDEQIQREDELGALLHAAPVQKLVPEGGVLSRQVAVEVPGRGRLDAALSLKPSGTAVVRFFRDRRRLSEEAVSLRFPVVAHLDGSFLPNQAWNGVRHDELWQRGLELVRRTTQDLALELLGRWRDADADAEARAPLEPVLDACLDDPELAERARALPLFRTTSGTYVSWSALEASPERTVAWVRSDSAQRFARSLAARAGGQGPASGPEAQRPILVLDGRLPKPLLDRLKLVGYATRLESEQRAVDFLSTQRRSPRATQPLVVSTELLPQGFSGVLGITDGRSTGVGVLVDGRLLQTLPQADRRPGLSGEITRNDLVPDAEWAQLEDPGPVEQLLEEIYSKLVIELCDLKETKSPEALLRYLLKAPRYRAGASMGPELVAAARVELFECNTTFLVSLERIVEMQAETGVTWISSEVTVDTDVPVIFVDELTRAVLQHHLVSARIKVWAPKRAIAPKPKKAVEKAEVPEPSPAPGVLGDLKLLLRLSNKRGNNKLQRKLFDNITIEARGKKPAVSDDGKRTVVNAVHALVLRAATDREALALLALQTVAEINRARKDILDSDELAFHHALVRQVLNAGKPK